MRAFILALAVLLPAPRQDAPDLLKSCEALFDPLTSLVPETRARARVDLVKLATHKREFLRTPVLPDAQIVLALLGENAAAKEVAKTLAEEPSAITRIAAEAIGFAGPDAAGERLIKLLDHEDLRIATAAGRSLSKAKGLAVGKTLTQYADQVDNPRRKVLATYALALNEPGHLPTLFAQSESTQEAVREAAWAALGNVPEAVDEMRRRLVEKDGVQTQRSIFEGLKVSAEVREAYASLLLRASLYTGPDFIELATHKIPEISTWARNAATNPLLLRKSVLIASLILRLGSYLNEADETKDPVPWLETQLAAQGIKGAGEKLK